MVYGICFCPVSRKEQLKDLKVAGRLSRHVRPVHVTCTSGSFSSHAPQASAVHVHIRLVLLTCTSGQCTSHVRQARVHHMYVRPLPFTCTSGLCFSDAFIPPQPSVSHSRRLLAPGSVASVFNHLLLKFSLCCSSQ